MILLPATLTSESTITVLCFASLRERLGGEPALVIRTPAGSRVAELRAALAARFPQAAPYLAHCRVAVEQEFVGDEAVLTDGDEVALIPPVSGG